MYATQQDIIDRYSLEELLILADRDDDGVADADVVDRALIDADAEVNAYLAAKYDLPLATTPDVITRLCVDIVMYRLADDAGTATDERRLRYDDAVTLLSRIAKGIVSLGLPKPPASSNGGVTVTSNDRRFKRGTLL
ncbi:gp436 family protein [Sulfuriflexus mobilis]|uniref:gp436 family protein n=1 Tax=Sulfuriflexus mobilis TaxID=1811807 RepID=UPI000F82121A|nr:DUF1320 domain-containing protein [Sulfuriflexus mobilis]